jgi:hypothetical protein
MRGERDSLFSTILFKRELYAFALMETKYPTCSGFDLANRADFIKEANAHNALLD